VVAQSTPEIVPTLVWSNSGHGHLEMNELVRDPNVFTQLAPKDADFVVTFLFDKLSTGPFLRDAGAFSSPNEHDFFSQALVETSASYVFAPYTIASGESLVNAFGTHTHFSMGDCEDFVDQILQSRPSRAVVDMSTSALKDSISCIARTTSELGKHGVVVAIVSAQHELHPIRLSFLTESDVVATSVAPQTLARFPGVPSATLRTQALSATSNTTNPGPLYITSNILFGLLLAAFLLSMVVFGVCCLSSVEAPRRFTSTPLSIGKEY